MASSPSTDSGDKVNDLRNKTEDFFTNENGYKIYCKYWCSDMKSPRGLVFMCHGAGEHCLYYTELAELLRAKELFVFSHDHQGNGQSGGPRMHISDFRHYTRDVFQHVDKIKERFPGLPVFIIGHSMGGAISILAGLDRPDYFTGVVLISPAVTPEQDTVGSIRIFFGKILARILPQCPVLWLSNEDISRDKAVCQKYKDDPLNYHGGLKARWALSILFALQEIEQKLSTIKWPFLVMHGDSDKIVNSKGSEALYREAASVDKTIKIYPGCYHQPHFDIEPVISESLQEIVDWVTKRLQ
ncbi:unnamed protein product [Candidula unifasciata]|uniref:Serine aminopeptidase S33 domain-containing protein n=1 Tax=Candidula unifasciata TaxID=100452 RepID=A0A8S3YSC6_9EUPU|nr:unnamed protein product [Candidula unifasciata]